MGHMVFQSREMWIKLWMLPVDQTRTTEDFDGHSAAPGGSAHPAGHHPIIEGTDSVAELPWRPATARCAATATRHGGRGDD
jgi:hypothetical protein